MCWKLVLDMCPQNRKGFGNCKGNGNPKLFIVCHLLNCPTLKREYTFKTLLKFYLECHRHPTVPLALHVLQLNAEEHEHFFFTEFSCFHKWMQCD